MSKTARGGSQSRNPKGRSTSERTLDAGLLERALGEQEAFDARERLVRVVVRLLDERELLALVLVEPALDAVRLLELLEREHEELCVVLVRERRERDRRKLARLEPVHGRRVDRDGLLRRDVRLREGCKWSVSSIAQAGGRATHSVLEVRVLPLLLGLEVEARQATEVLLRDGFLQRRGRWSASSAVGSRTKD